MKSPDPLKSAISIGNVADTSLALPSGDRHRTGPQRVLEQVQTMKRSRSRHANSRHGSTASLSPTSPVSDNVFTEAFKSSTSNGSVFFGNSFSKTLSLEANTNWQTIDNSKGSTVRRNTKASALQYKQSQSKASRSKSDLAWKQRPASKHSAPRQRLLYRAERSHTQSAQGQYLSPVNGTGQTRASNQFVCSQVDMASKTLAKPLTTAGKNKFDSGPNGSGVLTMKGAVEYLSKNDETYKHYGASYIQHNTFIDDKAKEEVLKLNGILPLVSLLRDPSSQVSQTSAAALRNLAFKNGSNKEEIRRCGGITEAVALLRDTESVEMQKQLTGLLWNLSSVDSLKPDLLKTSLPVLMERIILPYTSGAISNSLDPEVFFYATGYLRNLSSAKQNNRQVMRKCQGLVDSLVSYVKDCVDAGKPDDKSIENCVCVLHNLTFQLEAEAPALFSRIMALVKPASRSQSQGYSGPIGCFSPHSKMAEHECHFDFPVIEDPQPSGAGWLIHSKTLQSYLSLLGSSQQDEIQEACCGALQNLTSQEGVVSSVMSHIIVQKLNGLQVLSPFLTSNKVTLQRNTVALVSRLTQNPNLHTAIVRKALPELLAVLRAGTTEGNESDDTLAMACQTTNCLLMKASEMGRSLLNSNLIKSLNDLSQNRYFPKSSKAASLLLYNLWSDKDTQSFLKKQGMTKSSFVNDITTAAHKSIQVIE